MSKQNDKKIEEILSSLDGIKRAPAPDFFYTRLKARMENDLLTPVRRPVLLRPIFAFGTLLIVLLVNVAVIISRNDNTDNLTNADQDSIQTIAADYNLTDVSSLYDLNEDK